MEKPRKKKTLHEEDLLDDVFQSVSATDCTGLITSMPESRDQLRRYNEVYSYLPDPVGEDDREQPETTSVPDREKTKSPDKQEKQDDLQKELDHTEHDRLF